jgi:hypothetical protein
MFSQDYTHILSDENPEQLGEAEGHRICHGSYRICQAKAKRKIVEQFEGAETFKQIAAVRDTMNRFNHWSSNKTVDLRVKEQKIQLAT